MLRWRWCTRRSRTRTCRSNRSSGGTLSATLGAFLGSASRVEWVVNRSVESGNVVFNERVDRFEISSGWLELPVAGVFEVDDDGLITLWRDDFDMATYTNQLAALTDAG